MRAILKSNSLLGGGWGEVFKWSKIFFLFLFITNCSPSYKLSPEYQLVTTTPQAIENPYARVGEEYLYRATITAYGHSFSGLLATKIFAQKTWRVALTTDFGNTLLDLESQNGKSKVNYAIPDLNRKIVIRTLTDDFEKLLQTHFVITQKYTDGTAEVQQTKSNSDNIYLFTTEGKLQKQLNTKGKKLYTTIDYTSKNISITHHTLNIEISLNPI
ncbi:hypothetical protein RCZ04_19250 [Capnocytophaga sp. HP1101]